MQEIEVKILEINVEETKKKLEQLWAKKQYESPVIGRFFIDDKGHKIRLRTMNEKHTITYKHKIQNMLAKEHEEYETEIKDPEIMEQLLTHIWFSHYRTSLKYRISYVLDSLTFDIDLIDDIPPYMEIEATTMEDLQRGIGLLWYRQEDTSTLSEYEVRKLYGKW